MNERRNRQLSGVLGVFLVVVAVAAGVVFGDGALGRPLLLAQVLLMGLAGVADVVAAVDSPLTDLLAWYRWSGLGNVLLGLSLPLGFVGTSTAELALFVATGIGGLSLAAMGLDMLAFHGRYTRGEGLDR